MNLYTRRNATFNGGAVSAEITSTVPPGFILKHKTGADADAQDFNLGYAVFDVNDPDPRNNVVWGMGYNCHSSGNGQEVLGEPALNVVFESYYVAGGVDAAEFHVAFWDTNNQEHRTLSAFLPRDGGAGSVLNFKSEVINLLDFDGGQKIKFDLGIGTVTVVDGGLQFVFTGNNYSPFQQRNAADSAYLKLPYYGSDDRLKADAGLQVVGSTPTIGTYPNQFAVFQPTVLPANGVAMSVVMPSVVGSATHLQVGANCTGDLKGQIKNHNNTSGANNILELYVGGTSAGDPKMYFNVNGGTRWQCGADNSEGDRLAWNTAALGTDDKMILDTSGNLGLAGGITAVLPTSDPVSAGALWNDAGTVKVSAG